MRIAVGFDPGVLQDDVAVRDGIWTYLPNALLNRYGALRERGHILVSASELQDALVRYLWLAGARHSPSDEMSGECADLEYSGPTGTVPDRVECALIYLRGALSGEAAILAGAITSVLLREVGAPVDARVDGWTVAEVDEVIEALANGRSLVDVATKTLIAKYREIIDTADTTIPVPATPWPPPEVTATAPTGSVPFVWAGLPADGTFETAGGELDPAFERHTFGVTGGGACAGITQYFGGVSIVNGADYFRAVRYGLTGPDDVPAQQLDLRTVGIGVGDGWSPATPDAAMALTLTAATDAGVETYSEVAVTLPDGIEAIGFKYLYWAENHAPYLPAQTAADVVVRSPAGGEVLLDRTTTSVVGPFDLPCCPADRMADPEWGNPCVAVGGEPCPQCAGSRGGSLCRQSQIWGMDGCRTDYLHQTTACPHPVDVCWGGLTYPSQLEVLSSGYRTATVTREALGLGATGAAEFRIGLWNRNPDTSCPVEPLSRLGTCDFLDDRLQVDDLEFLDCAGNALTPASTAAAVCRDLTARMEAIGVTDATSPGLADDGAWGGIPSVEATYAPGLPAVAAIPVRTGDFGWRVSALLSPPPVVGEPGDGLEMDCEICFWPSSPCVGPIRFPAERSGNLLVCSPAFRLPGGSIAWVGGTVRWLDPVSLVSVRVVLPTLPIVLDDTPPAGIFDTFPANHATFLEGDPVFVRAELTDDTALATYECAPPTGVPGTGFGPSFFPDAYLMPAGSQESLAFQWPTPPISAPPTAEFAYEDFTLSCSAQDVAQREVVPPIDRAARVVRVPDFRVDPTSVSPGGELYDDPARDLRVVNREGDLTISTDIDPAVRAAMAAAGFLVHYELAIDPVELDDVAIGEWTGTFTFREEGVYYLQAVVGRFLTDGTWDPVKLSSNVVVVLVTGIDAEFLTPWVGSRGVSYPLARFWQDAEVKLVRPLTGEDYPRAGVPLEFRATAGVLQFADYSTILSGVLTDSSGRATVPLYATGTSGLGTIEVYEMRPGEDPERVFLADVPIETSRLRITSPSGNPLGATGSSDNEFCFNASDRGVLTIDTRAVWDVDDTPVGTCGADPDSVACRTTWEIEAIGSPGGPPTLAWDDARPDDALHGLGGENRATYTGLPPRYSDFGYRYVHLAYDLWPWESQPIEVFFAADADNHGVGCSSATDAETFRGSSSRCTNAAAYGFQVLGERTHGGGWRLFDSTLATAATGETPAVFNWARYRGRRNTILMGPMSYRCGTAANHCHSPLLRICGLARMSNMFAHEDAHVRQLLLYNATDFEHSIAGVVTSAEQICPTQPCGWAFAHVGDEVLPCPPPPAPSPTGCQYYNRFLDVPFYNHVFDGCSVDVCVDGDDDTVPDSLDPNPRFDGGEFEAFAYDIEGCDPAALSDIDWACPGRNAARSPEPGTGTCY